MNFVDYCIATKNYSVISAINNYCKMFSNDFTDYETEINNINFNKIPNYKPGNKLYKKAFPGQYAKDIDLKVAGKNYDELPDQVKDMVKERIRNLS